MLTSTPGRGRGMTVDVCYDSDKTHRHAGPLSTITSPSHTQHMHLASTSSEESPVKVTAKFVSDDSCSDQNSPLAADRMEPLSPPTAQQQWQQQHSLLPQHKHILQQHHQSQQQQQLQLQQEFMLQQQQQQQQQQIREDIGYQHQQQQLQDYPVQLQEYQAYPSSLNKFQQAALGDPFQQFQQHGQQDTPPRPQPQLLKTPKQQHSQLTLSNNSHPKQMRILQRQPQQLQQQGRQQQQHSTTSPPQVGFPSMVAPPVFPPNISPKDLTSLIDTSVPPPPIGVPIPGLHFPAAAKSPPLMYPTTTAFHAQPPRPTTPQAPSPQQPKTPPNLQHTNRFRPVKWQPDADGDPGLAFISPQDSPWDNIELGGGYSSPHNMDTGIRGPSPLSAPKAVEVPPSQGLSQKDHFQTKRAPGQQTRDAAQGPKQWNKKDKARGRGMPKKDVKGTSMSQHSKPHQGYNAYPPNGMTSSNQGQGSTKQQQEAGKSALQLSKEQKKNEYEWQSFKIIRKVRKLLGGLKEDSGKEKEIASEIVAVMNAESSRLACFPWPKEQFVALDEIFSWVMDNSELLDKTCKLIQELHCQHPQNFQEDLLNTVMKRQIQYIKVSTATNKDKLYTTFCGLLSQLFLLSRPSTNGLNKIIDKLLDSIVNKWISSDVQGTAEDPALLTDVYTSCLRMLFVSIGPHLARAMDQRYYKLLREQVLGGKPRFVKEAMLNLLLLRAADWQEEAFAKKNGIPEEAEVKQDLEESQRGGTTGEGTEVSNEVKQEVLQLGTDTAKGDQTTTDQTRHSAEMTAPADQVAPSITPKTQPDGQQTVTAISSPSSLSVSNNNSNSIQGTVAPPQNYSNSNANFQLLPIHSLAGKETNPSTPQMFFIPSSRGRSHGLSHTASVNSSYHTANQQQPPGEHLPSSHTNSPAQCVDGHQAAKRELFNPKSTTSPSQCNPDHSIAKPISVVPKDQTEHTSPSVAAPKAPSPHTAKPVEVAKALKLSATSQSFPGIQSSTAGINNVTSRPHFDDLQSNGIEDTEPSSPDIYGSPYTSEGAVFRNGNDVLDVAAYTQQEGKLSSPSRVVGKATQPRGSPASGRGMLRLEQGIGTAGSFLTSPLAYIQGGPSRDAAFKRCGSKHPEQETIKDQPSSGHAPEAGQFSTICPTQDSKPLSTDESNQDCCEVRSEPVESFPGADDNAAEDSGKQGTWLSPRHSEESFEEINDEYFASQGNGNQRFTQMNPEESNDRQGTGGEQQTVSVDGGAMSKMQRDEQGLEGDVSSDGNLGSEDPPTTSSNICEENSPKTLASTVSNKMPAGVGQYEQTGSTPGQPASPQVMKCSLCGSDKHRTRQCAIFKKYAPHAKSSDCEPETTAETPDRDGAQKPTSVKFGSVIFCSSCGQKDHVIYDCPDKGSFNFFLKNDDTII